MTEKPKATYKSIKKKVNGPLKTIVFVIVIFPIVVAIFFSFIKDATSNLDSLRNERESALLFLFKMTEIDLYINKIFTIEDNSKTRSVLMLNEELLAVFYKYENAAKKNYNDSYQKAKEYDPVVAEIRKQVYVILSYVKENNFTAAKKVYYGNASIWFSRINVLIKEDLEFTNKLIVLQKEKVQELRSFVIPIGSIFAIVCFVLVMYTKKLIIKSFVNPVIQISQQLIRKRNSQNPHTLLNFELNDEIGDLVQSHNDLLKSIVDSQKRESHLSKLASIGELAAGVGHEINNPLAIAVGYLSKMKRVIDDENIDNPLLIRALGKAENANDRIRVIVDGLRTYARSDEEKSETISLRLATSQIVGLISEIYEKENVSVFVENPEVDLYIKGVPGKLQQIFMNLVSNAKDATKGQDTREIRFYLKKHDHKMLKFSIKDNGSGIPDDIKGKILEPFFSTKEVGQGTGMGLGIVSKYIEEMGGYIEVVSEVGKGSCFSVYLPMVIATDIKLVQEEIDNLLDLKGNVLIVDDEESIREILRDYLERIGLKVDEADAGDTALEKVKEKKYDYIFTDMRMPRMTGREFIQHARKLPNGDTRYYVITGEVFTNYMEGDESNEKLKVDGLIYKPFSEESIHEVLYKSPIKI